jgi:hypothetical protein
VNRSTNLRSELSRIVLLIGVVMGLIGAPAFATTATSTQNPELAQNPELTVSASLTSNGPNPDVAAVGNTVTAAFSVTNKTFKFLKVNLRLVLTFPAGETIPLSVTIPLAPTQTLSPRVTITVPDFLPKGVYQLTTEASDANGVSSATAAITIL